MGTLPNSLEQRREPVPERMEAMVGGAAVRAQNQLTLKYSVSTKQSWKTLILLRREVGQS